MRTNYWSLIAELILPTSEGKLRKKRAKEKQYEDRSERFWDSGVIRDNNFGPQVHGN